MKEAKQNYGSFRKNHVVNILLPMIDNTFVKSGGIL